MTLTLGSLCSGYEGLGMAISQVLDVELVWVADNDQAAAAILAHRLPNVPNLGDITGVRWEDAVRVDVLAFGFPCTDLSFAGQGAGIKEGNRSGLWFNIADAIDVLRPRLIIVENVRAIVTRRPGLDVVLSDLARLGFDAEWICNRASDVGAAHPRERWFLVAHPTNQRHEWGWLARGRGPGPADGRLAVADTGSGGRRPDQPDIPAGQPDVKWGPYSDAIDRWARILGRPTPPPRLPTGRGGVEQLNPVFVEWLMGLPAGHVTAVPGLTRNQQLKALGNGVVPQQGAAAIGYLLDRIGCSADDGSEVPAA